MIELWLICFYTFGLMAAGCLAFVILGVLAHVFHAPLERLAMRLIR